MLELGYAKVDDNYKTSAHYQSFLSAQYSAKLYEEGMWATSLSEQTDRININTASSLQLQNTLDIEQPLANEIYSYRIYNPPYNSITEIMAVDPEFDEEWFADKRHLISVVTNVNKASYLEFTSLIGNASNAQDIINDIDYYTRFNEVKDLEELKSIKSFSGYYNQVEDYLTLDTMNTFVDTHRYVVNINTCNSDNFVLATNLNEGVYKKLASIREDDYLISTIGELYIYNSLFDHRLRHHYNDTMTTYTDINMAKEFELMSLFDQTEMTLAEKKEVANQIIDNRPFLLLSQLPKAIGYDTFDLIEPYVYIYSEDIDDRYNVNTVPEDELDDYDAAYKGRTTQFSNINQLSRNGLMDLHPDMTKDIVDRIIEYREKHFFSGIWMILRISLAVSKDLLYTIR